MARGPRRQGLYDPRFEHDACGVGFVCNIDGRASHDIVQRGLQVLVNLTHRGASGADPETGDGAGILLQIPHDFLAKECARLRIALPGRGEYGVGMLFLPQGGQERARCEAILAAALQACGHALLGWRDVPIDPDALGRTARAALPVIRQVFVGLREGCALGEEFERQLYALRRRIELAIAAEQIEGFCAVSFSSRTLVYKGLLLAHQVKRFYPDLANPLLVSGLALVHQRYSTNTWPTWELAQPFRIVCHNGEINTLRGNVNWMRAREATLRSERLGAQLEELLPVLDTRGSDSAIFDNALELLLRGGRELPHAMMTLVPEAWENDPLMPPEKAAFYRYHSCLMEPWDGPALMAFSDGLRVGAMLDRNGLRPARYWVTKDGFVVLASEAGVLPIDPADVLFKGRLQPGRMFLIDTHQGRIVGDEEVKREYVRRRPYAQWLGEHLLTLAQLPAAPEPEPLDPKQRRARQQLFGYTLEDLRLILAPMAAAAEEPIGSMGNDTPLACLSDQPALLYAYFKQMFAQVTNPAIDPIREESVMSLRSTLGHERNLLEETPEHAALLELEQPLLDDAELARIRASQHPSVRTATLPTVFPRPQDPADAGFELRRALAALRARAAAAVRGGATILILSDREAGPDAIPIPSLLAVSAVHHGLIREGLRMHCGLIADSGDAREIAHFALLIGYGAAAVNPYMAHAAIDQLVEEARYVPADLTRDKARAHYRKAIGKGLLKIFAKMGISTLRSYRGAQIFEAVGIAPDVVDEYFVGTYSRIGGVTLGILAEETRRFHARAYGGPGGAHQEELETGGQYQWRRDGERHLFNPRTVHKLQQAARTASYELYQEYAKAVNEQARALCTIRGLLRLRTQPEPIPLAEVESASEIMKRFCTGAMSFGSISAEAHEMLAVAMNRIGGKSNSGEGGEDPDRFARDPSGDSRRSAIKQVASGRFGVTSWYLTNADELQIKIAQGAKPGEGGQLPGYKVDSNIARVRHSTPGVGLISPPPHHDIYSIEDLAQLIHDLKNSNPRADVSVKLVSVSGVGTIAAGVSKGHAESVLIAGHDGGTGASPLTSIKHAGTPWEIGLAEAQQALVLNDLRGRIRVHVDGQLKTGRDVVIGALLGAEEFGFGTAALVALGCIMMRVCHLNTCPVGVATQRPELRARFTGQPEHAIQYLRFVAEEARELMAALGIRRFDDLVGRADLLEADAEIRHWKLPKGLDFSEILHLPDVGPEVARRRVRGQQHGLANALDVRLIELCEPALERMEPVEIYLPIRNVNRTVGTMLGAEVSARHGLEGLPDNTIRIRLGGSAGQSFGAFLPHGITLTLVGDANDYIGKGLSGGRLIVYPPRPATFEAANNILVGNVALYGATSGAAFFSGMAGERFCVRNSGAQAVVEGVGDHGCEYMTGGRVVILGRTGRNFAAGMSGGIAYVYTPEPDFEPRCNRGMVDLEKVTDPVQQKELWHLIDQHFRHTRSKRAEHILEHWPSELARFTLVIPRDYRRAMAELGGAAAQRVAVHG